jgi:DNA-binding GntR family transcriptional regulator
LPISSAPEQVAHHLREQLMRKVWVGMIHGAPVLARQRGLARMTIDAALSLLEKEG